MSNRKYPTASEALAAAKKIKRGIVLQKVRQRLRGQADALRTKQYKVSVNIDERSVLELAAAIRNKRTGIYIRERILEDAVKTIFEDMEVAKHAAEVNMLDETNWIFDIDDNIIHKDDLVDNL